MAADPENGGNLLACSMVSRPRLNQGMHATETAIAYRSVDGGLHWKAVLEASLPSSAGPAYAWRIGDPSCAFGFGGNAYFFAMSLGEMARDASLQEYVSHDSGATWSLATSEPGTFDRPYVSVDTTGGRFRGRVYATVDSFEIRPSVARLYVSGEASSVQQLSVYRDSTCETACAGGVVTGNSAVLSDGTLVHSYQTRPACSIPGSCPYDMKIALSTDGGVTFQGPLVVAPHQIACPQQVVGDIPTIASDTSASVFRDTIYAAWSSRVGTTCRIFVSRSTDRGRTWSKPAVVDDDRPRLLGPGPDDFMPTIAVNNRGVVGVMWYDRRNNPDDRGYSPRFAASLDGGLAFTPSVPLTSARASYDVDKRFALGTTDFFFGKVGLSAWDFEAGNTAGIAADRNGVFHPLWVDNRTGVSQVWTATAYVQGGVYENGSPSLALYNDITKNVRVDFVNAYYDGPTRRVTLDAYITNVSGENLRAPLKLRLLSVRSDVAGVSVANAGNGATGANAVFDLGALLPQGVLRPGQQSPRALHLVFHLSDVRRLPPPGLSDPPMFSFVDVRIQVLAARLP